MMMTTTKTITATMDLTELMKASLNHFAVLQGLRLECVLENVLLAAVVPCGSGGGGQAVGGGDDDDEALVAQVGSFLTFHSRQCLHLVTGNAAAAVPSLFLTSPVHQTC